ncbi:MAG: NAD-dependent epimerase/dehydratase family protein [Micrococcaceae bacterium]
MQILILGGNGQLGRHMVHHFVDASHSVMCLARGTRPVSASAEFVGADRDRSDALNTVSGNRWDVVVDVATQPGHVRRAVHELEAAHWIYVSSVNVYQRGDLFEPREDSPLHQPLESDTLTSMEDYGPAKVACEDAVRLGTTSSTIIRPGLIAGDADETGRSGYYSWKFAHPAGADVVVPDDLEFPIAMIDVKDLSRWIMRCAEDRVQGTFNATGPTHTLESALDAARNSAGSKVPCRPVAPAELARTGISPWMGPDSLPWWIPDPALRFAATADTSRARQYGLTFRPLAATLKDALGYEETRGGPHGAGLSDDAERRIRDLSAA